MTKHLVNGNCYLIYTETSVPTNPENGLCWFNPETEDLSVYCRGDDVWISMRGLISIFERVKGSIVELGEEE